MKQMPKLYYKLDCSSIFCDPQPIIKENEIGKFKLEDEVLVIEFKEQLETICEYRAVVNPILKSWQLEAQLINHLAGIFEFRYWKAELHTSAPDLNDNHEEENIYEKDNLEILIISIRVYPSFPSTLFTYEMEIAWKRFYNAKIGIGESIQSAAYFALTVAINFAGGNYRNAAKTLYIDNRIFKKIGEFASIKGNEKTARKSLGESAVELTFKEVNWLDYAIRLIIIQIGKINNGNTPSNLNYYDLPELSS